MAQDELGGTTDMTGQLGDTNLLMKDLQKSADAFGKITTKAFASGIVEGRRFDETLKGIGKSMMNVALRSALKPLQTTISSGLQGLIGKLFKPSTEDAVQEAAPEAFARGGVFSSGRVRAFADGGVVAAPTYFPMADGQGLMGERGAEAIMPLGRGPDGKLGVRAEGGRPVNITLNIATPDAESFRRSEAQVSAAIARAAARGRRAL